MLGSIMALALMAMDPQVVQIAGPEGPLEGELIDVGADTPLVIIVPGSGPTDRDGNNPLAVKGGPLAGLAEGLATRGVSSLRIDKRGMFGSSDAIADPNKVTASAYAQDIADWAAYVVAQQGRDCAWVAGHSEGGLMTLIAAKDSDHLCGTIMIASLGRPMLDVIDAQLSAQLPAPTMAEARTVIAKLESGERVASEDINPMLLQIFAPPVQDYMIDVSQYDAGQLARDNALPMLILRGDKDGQVMIEDADALAAARPDAVRIEVAGANHALRQQEGEGPMAMLASYGDADAQTDPAFAEAIAAFVCTER